jgi:parallel beta-helix repeat protein
MVRSGLLLLAVLLLGTVAPCLAEEPVLEISADAQLDPARSYGAIVIKASNITVDGRGAWLVGARDGDPKAFKGVAISARGVSNVTLRNVSAKGWETGLHVVDASGWTIEHCNFSDNFHDPEFGCGENGRRGGIVLERVSRSRLEANTANRVWDACVLVESHDNSIIKNDYSHTSDTCLKLWSSCGNAIERNKLSYGLRIKTGEVHARDSCCVLIESGSNHNRLTENDCTHGGDGIFVRVLNGWVSTGNVFERNDVSYANNNGFEAWSPRNTYRRNTANRCSYGFWLGASDQTVLEGNEASYNGTPEGFYNSPHLPDAAFAGIVFMFGPSSHTIVRGNTCRGNNGAGIALVGDLDTQGKKWRAFHWIIESNSLLENRWGIYALFADWIDLAANRFRGNTGADFHHPKGVTNVFEHPDNPSITDRPRAVLDGPARAVAGEKVVFDAGASRDPAGRPLTVRWDLGDGQASSLRRVERTFSRPGFYHVGLTVNNGRFSDLAWRDFYVVGSAPEIGTAGPSSRWVCQDTDSRASFHEDASVRIVGDRSIRASINPYGGGRVTLVYRSPTAALPKLLGKTRLVFWLRAINPNVPAWQGPNPLVSLRGSDGSIAVLEPNCDLLSAPPYNEAREGWTYLEVPLRGDRVWKFTRKLPDNVSAISLGFDSWGAPPLQIWIDGMALE